MPEVGILPRMPPDTQTDPPHEPSPHTGPSPGLWVCSPLVLAIVVTLANAAKPVVIDDTAYLSYARHIAATPLDPYGFRFFWYDVPQPAMEVLAPPVVPYWIAVGIRLFGEQVALLKLWMFPFVWLFAWSVRELLRRFARGTESRLLPLLVLTPAVLPTVNLMLDIPALSLGLAAVVLFARAVDFGSWRLAVAVGLVTALAMQTKYTMLLIPPALGWYGFTYRRIGLATVSVLAAVVGFALWELLLIEKYGQSHFLYHARSQSGDSGILASLNDKADLGGPLVGYLGCLGIGVGLVAGFALGVRRQVLVALGVLWGGGVALIAVIPHRWTILIPRAAPTGVDLTAVMVFWQCFGTLVLVGIAGCAVLLTLRFSRGHKVRANPEALFLAGWFLIELAGYFVLTPFGAARRVIGLTVVGGLLAGRALSRVERLRSRQRLPRWIIGFGIVAGVIVTAIDTFDAFPEKVCAERAAAMAAQQAPGSTVWYAGHWGFQYYCERAGMRAVVPGESVLKTGDVLVLPALPDAHGLFRPHIDRGPAPPPVAAVLGEVIWDDALSAQSVPNFYCGVDPLVGRDHPRLRVVVYRLTRDWAVGR